MFVIALRCYRVSHGTIAALEPPEAPAFPNFFPEAGCAEAVLARPGLALAGMAWPAGLGPWVWLPPQSIYLATAY